MVKAVTRNIAVSVETFFKDKGSRPDLGQYLFAYRITIRNQGDYTVQLMSRYWEIFDSCMERRIVEGEGVVGAQPVLEPGETFQYQSYCQLSSDTGTMRGYYTFQRQPDELEFEVEIPQFLMMPGYRNN